MWRGGLRWGGEKTNEMPLFLTSQEMMMVLTKILAVEITKMNKFEGHFSEEELSVLSLIKFGGIGREKNE